MDSKYKQTQKLLKIAIDAGGYTNVEIAKKAGLKESSGSLVSRWRNGKALATERQMQYFINEYGGNLKRKNTHLFYSYVLNKSKNGYIYDYRKISGEEIFSHKFSTSFKVVPSGSSSSSNESIKAYKVVVLEAEKGYVFVKLVRAGFYNYTINYSGALTDSINPKKDEWLHGDSENSNWFFQEIVECESFDKLVLEFQKYTEALQSTVHPRTAKPICSSFDTEPVKFSFYQKFMKLGLQSEHIPF